MHRGSLWFITPCHALHSAALHTGAQATRPSSVDCDAVPSDVCTLCNRSHHTQTCEYEQQASPCCRHSQTDSLQATAYLSTVAQESPTPLASLCQDVSASSHVGMCMTYLLESSPSGNALPPCMLPKPSVSPGLP